jgi:hypothetical protein
MSFSTFSLSFQHIYVINDRSLVMMKRIDLRKAGQGGKVV